LIYSTTPFQIAYSADVNDEATNDATKPNDDAAYEENASTTDDATKAKIHACKAALTPGATTIVILF